MLVPALCLVLASVPSATPTALVKSADAAVQRVLKGADPTTAKLATAADQFIDFFELAKRALGGEWSKLNKKQQDDFSATMKGLLRASYAQKAITDERGTATVEYGDEKVEGNEALVKTTLVVKADKFPVDYKLYKSTKGKWKIYDVITDEVSLVATYNDQFRQAISKKGFDGLLTSLKAKREQLEREPTAQK